MSLEDALNQDRPVSPLHSKLLSIRADLVDLLAKTQFQAPAALHCQSPVNYATGTLIYIEGSLDICVLSSFQKLYKFFIHISAQTSFIEVTSDTFGIQLLLLFCPTGVLPGVLLVHLNKETINYSFECICFHAQTPPRPCIQTFIWKPLSMETYNLIYGDM